MKLAIVRVRGSIGVRTGVNQTLTYLRLDRVNHCVVVDDSPTTRGMIKKAKDYITWGTPSLDMLAAMLKKRGRLVGDKPVTDEYVKESTGGKYKTIDAFVKAWADGKETVEVIPDLKPVFRLHPPRKGHGAIKRHVTMGGALGDRKEEIDKLIERMI